MKKRAQAPKSSRNGCVSAGPNARPATRLKMNGTPQASATNIAASAARKQRVLPQHPEPPLQFEKRPAVRGQIFPDLARFVLIRVYADGDICSRSQIHHVPEPFHPRSPPLH